MNETPEVTVQEEPAQAGKPSFFSGKTAGIPNVAWLAAGGCLLCFCCALVIGLALYFGLPLLGGDPIVEVVPNDSMVYVSIDLLQTQSDRFNDILNAVQEVGDAEETKSMEETLDDLMDESFHMSFTDDVVPWIGQYSAFVVTDGDLATGEDLEFMVIVETRSKGSADEFVSKFVSTMEDEEDKDFDKNEKDGVTVYVYEDKYSKENNIVIARAGDFVYLSNSEDAVLRSAGLSKSDSLANVKGYKDAVKALPKGRLATLYVSGDAYSRYFDNIVEEMYYYSPTFNVPDSGVAGIAVGLSATDAGLQADIATAYDPDQLNDFQKETLKGVYKDLTADKMVPGDTFVFMGVNSSLSPARFTDPDNPLYTSDVEESFDLMDKESGINVPELLNLLSGEVVVAVGPARDGLFADFEGVDIGATVVASTNDAPGFVDWFESMLRSADLDYETDPLEIGGYKLNEVSVDMFFDSTTFIYGADKGYIILGTSKSALESGLKGGSSLADNATYRDTWKSFPSGSRPYLYVNVTALMDFLVDNSDSYSADDMRNARRNLEKVPVVAAALNQNSGYVQSLTIIVFVSK
ncbi:MAG: DUF3352 domain-containing protein [Chloroflexota bacterium]